MALDKGRLDADKLFAAKERLNSIVAAARMIYEAWTVPGPSPAYHRQQKDRLRREWPRLYQALEALVVAFRPGKGG